MNFPSTSSQIIKSLGAAEEEVMWVRLREVPGNTRRKERSSKCGDADAGIVGGCVVWVCVPSQCSDYKNSR